MFDCVGNIGQQEVSFSRLADDPVNANDSLRSSRSDRSDEDSDSEEAYTSPASRKAWLEQRSVDYGVGSWRCIWIVISCLRTQLCIVLVFIADLLTNCHKFTRIAFAHT